MCAYVQIINSLNLCYRSKLFEWNYVIIAVLNISTYNLWRFHVKNKVFLRIAWDKDKFIQKYNIIIRRLQICCNLNLLCSVFFFQLVQLVINCHTMAIETTTKCLICESYHSQAWLMKKLHLPVHRAVRHIYCHLFLNYIYNS